MAKKHLVVEWLSWSPCTRDFINSTILETWKDIPNTLPSLKLLIQRVHELVGGSTVPPPPPLDNVVGSKRLRSGRVEAISYIMTYLIKSLTAEPPPPSFCKISLFSFKFWQFYSSSPLTFQLAPALSNSLQRHGKSCQKLIISSTFWLI